MGLTIRRRPAIGRIGARALTHHRAQHESCKTQTTIGKEDAAAFLGAVAFLVTAQRRTRLFHLVTPHRMVTESLWLSNTCVRLSLARASGSPPGAIAPVSPA